MGVFRRGNALWVRFKGPDGKWRNERTGYVAGQEAAAEKVFRSLADQISAGVELVGARKEPVTVEEYARLRWFEQRRPLIADWKGDERRLEMHAFPKLGRMRLREVRPRHLAELFRALRGAGEMAPKTVHHVYGVVKALFRDAAIDGLIDASPCILTQHQLGESVDADPEWRATAIYSRDELELLISDGRLPGDRRLMYALEGVAGLRHGEAAGLRWRHFEPTTPVLGRLTVATSYDKGRTKTSRPRHVPVHPTLAAMLAEWKLSGWPGTMGRTPEPDDLVVPTPNPTNRGPRVAHGSMRTRHYSHKRLVADLKTLGLRHRRGHDLRRTFISLARTDGARKDILELVTHTPGRSQAIDVYTSFPWEALCEEVLKLKVHRESPNELIPLAIGDSRYTLVTADTQPTEIQQLSKWRRRESNPGPKAFVFKSLRA